MLIRSSSVEGPTGTKEDIYFDYFTSQSDLSLSVAQRMPKASNQTIVNNSYHCNMKKGHN